MTEPLTTLRVLDAGTVDPLRSQTVWQALGDEVAATGQATLCFAQPDRGYACLGYHRRLEELDLRYCTAAALPVLRRLVGGGPVYCDQNQLFFALVLPLHAVSADRLATLRRLLTPAVEAFRRSGVDARLDQGEICSGDRKICGHGAGQLGEAVVVCGNLIRRFDYAAATRILALPDAACRAEVGSLMRRYVRATPCDPASFRDNLVTAYAQALGLVARADGFRPAEQQAIARLEERFTDPQWLAGPAGPARASTLTKIKIREGVYVTSVSVDDATLLASCVQGRVVRAVVHAAGQPRWQAVESDLVGAELDALPDRLCGLATRHPWAARLADAWAA